MRKWNPLKWDETTTAVAVSGLGYVLICGWFFGIIPPYIFLGLFFLVVLLSAILVKRLRKNI